ncbi:MAG: ImmA/IrrE family metallo-endopeptidase [Dehalococcoidia bacterium]
MESIYRLIKSGDDEARAHLRKVSGELTTQKAIECLINKLLYAYERKYGDLRPPINAWLLARLVEAEVEAAPPSLTSEGQLLPVQGGFIIRYRMGLPLQRIRLTICHEIAHTFFYDRSLPVPKRPLGKRPTSEEEQICFQIARQLLVPQETLRGYMGSISNFPRLSLLSRLAKTFQVSLPVMAMRLTQDTSLISNSIFTFWEIRNPTNIVDRELTEERLDNFVTRSFKPKLSYLSPSLAQILSTYWRTRLFRTAGSLVEQAACTGTVKSKSLEIGKRKRFQFLLEARGWGADRMMTAASLGR